MFDLGNIIESYLLILIIIFFSLLILIFIFISIILTQRPKTTYSSTPLRKFFRGEKIDHEKWIEVNREDIFKDENHNYDFSFITYKKINL